MGNPLSLSPGDQAAAAADLHVAAELMNRMYQETHDSKYRKCYGILMDDG